MTNIKQTIICPECNGSGYSDKSELLECSKCGGDGEIRTINKQTWREKFDEILEGIDKTENEVDCGWWETSFGAKFGKMKKEEIQQFIEKTLQEQREEIRRAEKDRVIRIVTEYFEKGLGFNKGSMNDSVFEGLKDALLKELKK